MSLDNKSQQIAFRSYNPDLLSQSLGFTSEGVVVVSFGDINTTTMKEEEILE